ncbi:MAG: hypothetical protein KDD50_08425 [Bdellovibrionales bacterium]|nr:hypothetical protein [Bdellovibrionales bacterium]
MKIKFVFIGIFILLIIGAIQMNKNLSQQQEFSKNLVRDSTLRIECGMSGTSLFSNSAPVNVLESFLTLVLGQLIYINEDFNLNPGLLESYNYDTDKDIYYLSLKKDLNFHNGRKVNSKDLEYSILRGFFSKKKNWWPSFLGNIAGLEKIKPGMTYKSGLVSGLKIVDDFTISISLKNPNPSFLHSLARSYFSLVPKEELKADHLTWKKYPVGSGEYKVETYNKSKNQVVLKLVNKYHKKPNLILFSGTKLKSPDVILSGDVVRAGYQPESLLRSSKIITLFFNYKSPLGRNENFRKAIDFTIKRVDLISSESPLKPTFHIVPRHIWGRKRVNESSSLVEARKYIEQLKSDLKEHRYLNQTLIVPVYKVSENEFNLKKLINQLSSIGIRVRFYESTKKTNEEDFSEIPFRISSLGADVVDPLVQYSLFSGSSFLYPQYPDDSQYKTLLEKAAKAKSIDTRSISVREISEYFYNHRIALPLFESSTRVYIKPHRFTSLGQQDGGTTFYADRVQFQGESQ